MRARPFLIALLLAAGCEEPFPPPNRVQELRVLAIKSEPVAPAPGETTTLSALVYTPENDPTLTYSWSWCPLPGSANEGYPCAIDEAMLAAIAGSAGQTLPPYDLGTGATAQLPHTLDPTVLKQICSAGAGSMRPTMIAGQSLTLDCNGGFPVQVKLKVKTATDEVIAVRRLRIRLEAGGEPSTNPTIGQLFRTKVNVHDDDIEESADPITMAPDIRVVRGQESHLRVEVADTVAETYTGRNDDLQPFTTRERMTISWFVESGNTADIDTHWVPDFGNDSKLSEAVKNEWEPGRSKDYPRSTARLFVVLRDNRDGVAWTEGVVQLEEP